MAIAVSTEEAVPRINAGFVVLFAAGAALGGFLFGFDSAVINGAVPGIQARFAATGAATGFAVAALPPGAPALGVLAFGLAGLGCSALLPLTISFGRKELAALGAATAGTLIAFYQMGYGLAAFGVGPLERVTGLDLGAIYGLASVVALALGALSFAVVRGGQPAEPESRVRYETQVR